MNVTPSLFVLNKGEQSIKLSLSLTKARRKVVVRLTGGCGFMSHEDSEGLYDLFVNAFRGYDGAILFGGTRMLNRHDYSQIIPGITEIPPKLREHCPKAVILGVVPKTDDLSLRELGMIIHDDESENYITIVHPCQDLCVIVQESVDNQASWETEHEECLNIISGLRKFAEWDSLLISYNGGGVTKKEVLATAELGWPVLLIKGSGRTTDILSEDNHFLESHPNVIVAEKNVKSIRRVLTNLNFLDQDNNIIELKRRAINE